MAQSPAAANRIAVRTGSPGRRSLRARLAGRSGRVSFEQVFREHHQAIYRYCLAIVRNAADAEDALQATMAAALRSLDGEDREVAIKPWLFRVAHNESISIIRGRREQPAGDELPELEGDSAAERVESKERLRTLVADLRALPERQRSALVMRELSGLSYPEIGAALECGEGAARQLVYEARNALSAREEGRRMECDEARRAISDGDGRRLRGRRLAAHLSACETCRDFKAAIEYRERDLRALCPPLPIGAAGGVLAALGAGGGAGTAGGAATAGAAGAGAGATGLAGTVAGSAALKGASVLAAAVIAAGVSDATGVVSLPGPLDLDHSGESTNSSVPAAAGSGAAEAPGTAAETTGAAGKPGSERARQARSKGATASAKKGANGRHEGRGWGKRKGGSANRHGQGRGSGGASSNAGGNPSAPGGGKPSPPPQSGGNPSPGPPATAPAPSGSGGGSSGGANAGGGPPASSNAGGSAGGGQAPSSPSPGAGGPPG